MAVPPAYTTNVSFWNMKNETTKYFWNLVLKFSSEILRACDHRTNFHSGYWVSQKAQNLPIKAWEILHSSVDSTNRHDGNSLPIPVNESWAGCAQEQARAWGAVPASPDTAGYTALAKLRSAQAVRAYNLQSHLHSVLVVEANCSSPTYQIN